MCLLLLCMFMYSTPFQTEAYTQLDLFQKKIARDTKYKKKGTKCILNTLSKKRYTHQYIHVENIQRNAQLFFLLLCLFKQNRLSISGYTISSWNNGSLGQGSITAAYLFWGPNNQWRYSRHLKYHTIAMYGNTPVPYLGLPFYKLYSEVSCIYFLFG